MEGMEPACCTALLAAVSVLAGCNLIWPYGPAGLPDGKGEASTRDRGVADQRSSDLAGPSWPTRPFANLQPLAAFNTSAGEDDLSLPDDEREAFFNRAETEVWTAKRASASAPWGEPQAVTELNNQMPINSIRPPDRSLASELG